MKPKILLIEDDFTVAKNLQAMLELQGAEMTHAQDGLTGLTEAKRLRPDLILLDIILPNIDGFEVCRGLKSDKATRDIPVLMITGMGTMGHVEKAFSVGAVGYIIKPIEPARLFRKIEELLPGFGAR